MHVVRQKGEALPLSEQLWGIDVSNHQVRVDWASVASAGATFAFAKASEGSNFADGWFASNWQGMKAAGLVRGAYHFARPSRGGPITEANWFLRNLGYAGGVEPGDILVLDLEDDGVEPEYDLTFWVNAWVQAVREAVGFSPIIYSRLSYLAHHSGDSPDIWNLAVWLADYNSGVTPPSGALIWQYTDMGTMRGITTNFDMNRAYLTIEELRELGMPQPTPQPTPEPTTSRQTAIDVTNGWSIQLELSGDQMTRITSELQTVIKMVAQASKELASLRDIITRDWPTETGSGFSPANEEAKPEQEADPEAAPPGLARAIVERLREVRGGSGTGARRPSAQSLE